LKYFSYLGSSFNATDPPPPPPPLLLLLLLLLSFC
jgi:hypothetical protein